MNKLLATSALVAAGLMATPGVASAQSPAPIQVVVGGYMIQYFGIASNNDNVNFASGNGRNAAAVVGQMNKTSQQHDSEIWFGGRTTLANGITVGFDVQLEGASNNYQGAQPGGAGATQGDTIDEVFAFVDGAFGRLLIGAENGAAYLMHYGAPAPGATSQWGANEFGSSWINAPAAITFNTTTQVTQTGDTHKLTYFTPRMAGFQLGASFAPNALEDWNGFSDVRAARTNATEYSINYVNTVGGISIAASAGAGIVPEVDGVASNNALGNSIRDFSYGLQVGYAGVTVGGSWRSISNSLGASDGTVWSAGIGYQKGPIALTASYLESKANGLGIIGDDVVKQTILGGAYNLGPGVDVIGAIINQSYKDETGLAVNQNSGSAGIVGLRLFF